MNTSELLNKFNMAFLGENAQNQEELISRVNTRYQEYIKALKELEGIGNKQYFDVKTLQALINMYPYIDLSSVPNTEKLTLPIKDMPVKLNTTTNIDYNKHPLVVADESLLNPVFLLTPPMYDFQATFNTHRINMRGPQFDIRKTFDNMFNRDGWGHVAISYKQRLMDLFENRKTPKLYLKIHGGGIHPHANAEESANEFHSGMVCVGNHQFRTIYNDMRLNYPSAMSALTTTIYDFLDWLSTTTINDHYGHRFYVPYGSIPSFDWDWDRYQEELNFWTHDELTQLLIDINKDDRVLDTVEDRANKFEEEGIFEPLTMTYRLWRFETGNAVYTLKQVLYIKAWAFLLLKYAPVFYNMSSPVNRQILLETLNYTPIGAGPFTWSSAMNKVYNPYIRNMHKVTKALLETKNLTLSSNRPQDRQIIPNLIKTCDELEK